MTVRDHEVINIRYIYTTSDLGKLQWSHPLVSQLVQMQSNKIQCNNDNGDNKNN